MIELTPDMACELAACPTCGAQPGDLCASIHNGRSMAGAVHAERAEAAERVAHSAINRHPDELDRPHRIPPMSSAPFTAAIAELAEAITTAELDDLHAPEVVTALAAVLALGGRANLGRNLIEAQADAHPDEWAEHGRRQAEAMLWQHDEDEHQQNGGQ